MERGGFRLNLFLFCSFIFAYRVCQRHMRTQNVWFNLQRVFTMDDVTSAQRWFPHSGARPPLTRQQSRYGPEVIALAVTTKRPSDGFSRWMTSHPPRDDFLTQGLGRLLCVNNYGTVRKYLLRLSQQKLSHRLEARLIYWEYLRLPLTTWFNTW